MSEINLDVEQNLWMIQELAEAIMALSNAAQTTPGFEQEFTLRGMSAIGEMIRIGFMISVRCIRGRWNKHRRL